MSTQSEKNLLKRFNDNYPYPSCMEMGEAPNPAKAKEVWREMEKKGYVKITHSARCGFEALRGEFVTLTKAGLHLISTPDELLAPVACRG